MATNRLVSGRGRQRHNGEGYQPETVATRRVYSGREKNYERAGSRGIEET